MTPIGRFSLKTETKTNPSVPTLFIALSPPTHNQIDSMTVPEFESVWHKRKIPTLHPRFHYKVSSVVDGHFEDKTHARTLSKSDEQQKNNDDRTKEVTLSRDNYVSETIHMNVYRKDLKKRIEDLVSTAMDVKDKLWFVQISSGELGSSGAISKHKVEEIKKERGKNSTTKTTTPLKETVLLFKFHHSLGDAVSLTAALGDLLDEAQDIRKTIEGEIAKRKKKSKSIKWWKKMLMIIQKLIWFLFGSLQVLIKQIYLSLITRRNPFLQVLDKTSCDELTCGRSISWCDDVARVDDVKYIAKKLGGKGATVNDIFVSCVSAAIARQLVELREEHGSNKSKVHKKMNVVVPCHLAGGILPPGREIGNLIGAFVTQVPCEMKSSSTASDRLREVHYSLYASKKSPAPILSFLMAKFVSQWVPEKLAVKIFHQSSANAAVAVTNARGFEKKVHINGRPVESMGGFLPLPPNIPVGVVVSSYGNVVSLSINAEKWAVPDADKFLTWVLDEYKLLVMEASQ